MLKNLLVTSYPLIISRNNWYHFKVQLIANKTNLKFEVICTFCLSYDAKSRKSSFSGVTSDMPRKYRPVLGPTAHRNYDQGRFEQAVKDVLAGKASLRAAAEKFQVPKSTLADHVKARRENRTISSEGRPCVLAKEEENQLVDGLILCGEWGYPLHASDVQDTVQSFLNRKGKIAPQFKENRPGHDWVWSFLRRHPTLTKRLAENIKRSRAAVGVPELEEYFENISVTLAHVPPENLVNFDETNFTDDPGAKKVLVRRGCRHPERIIDHSKTSISVMMAASASGQLLPPYTLYKAKYLYPTWIEDGLPESRYAVSNSGWFEMPHFEDWFVNICVPFFRDKTGKKAVIGDNLASHLSSEVVNLCVKLGIEFILLPPNATHLCQPLDVAFFKALKAAWRKTLEEWKKRNRGVVPKSEFPKLLRQAVESMGEKVHQNVVAGFKACGLVPLNKEEVLKRIPRNMQDSSTEIWSRALIDKLEETRKSESPKSSALSTRGKRLMVRPGKSLTSASTSGNNENDLQAVMNEESDPSDSSDEEDDNNEETEEIEDRGDTVVPELKENDFILVQFTTKQDRRLKYYVGQIVNDLGDEGWETRFLRKVEGRKSIWFSFPQVPDVETISRESIIAKLDFSDGKRGKWIFPKLQQFVNIRNVL